MSFRLAASALLLASLVNTLPLLVAHVGGDIEFHQSMMQCFAGQFWQGDVYPRWCMNANAGLGSPVTLFYFPLPYVAAALFYPLTHLGVPLYGIYVLSILLATFATGLACYAWLKDIVAPGPALLASLLFLFMPYRMEVMLFRSGYAELWGMALLPLAFKYTRSLTKNEPALLPLAAIFGLLFLTHLPSAAIAALFGGAYVLIVSQAGWPPKFRYGASVFMGLALAAFYVVPAVYYKQFMVDASLTQGVYGWPNTYLRLYNFTELGQKRQIIMIGVTLLALLGISLVALRRRSGIDDAFLRREIVAWSALSAIALFLLFSVSAPFYALLGPLSQVVFPWRMQAVFMLALAFFLGVWMQYFVSDRRMKTWKGDYAILLAFLVLTAYFSLGVREDVNYAFSQKVIPTTPAVPEEYRTRWTDNEHFGLKYVVSRWEHKDGAHAADIVSGKGKITVEHWAWDGILLQVKSPHGMTVRLNHLYFPAWSARADDGEPVTLTPEAATGQMLLDIPAGGHRIHISYAVSTANPWLVWLADGVSALAFLALVYRRRGASLF